MKNKSYIYGLIDPRTNKIRYIGQTIQSLKNRLNGHIGDAKYNRYNRRKENWIKSLFKLKLEPLIEIIEECSKEKLNERESYWISYYNDNDLTNLTPGGDNSYNSDNYIQYKERYWNNKRKVYSYNEFTKEILEYSNILEASEIVDCKHTNIPKAIHIKGRCKDLYWSYDSKDFNKFKIKPWINRKLIAVTNKEGITKIYKNLKQAAICLGIPLSRHNTFTKIRKGEIKEMWGYKFENRAHLKPGELLEDCDVNQQPNSLKSENKVSEEVQRLTVEEDDTNNTDTSARQLYTKVDDIVRSTLNKENVELQDKELVR